MRTWPNWQRRLIQIEQVEGSTPSVRTTLVYEVNMLRRHFVKLLALLPFALRVEPRHPGEIRCETCDVLVGTVSWPMKVDKDGHAWCVKHATHHPRHEPGKGLITEFHFGVYPEGWAAYQKACFEGNTLVTPV